MTQPWTPGPWYWRREYAGAALDLFGDDKTMVLSVVSENPDEPVRVLEADARLIAAAPEMVEVLVKWLDSYEGAEGSPSAATRQLLSRIRGEANDSPGPSPRLLAETE